MKTVSLKANPREGSGTTAANNLRKEGLVPGVIYGGENPVHFAVPAVDLNPIIYTGEFFQVDVEVDGETYTTITKDIQFHPVTDEVLHIDFLELEEGKRVKTSIPVHLEGKPVGVTEGGILQHKLLRLNVRVKPENMVEHLSLDVTDLDLGKSFKVKDLDAGEMEVLDSDNIPVASVISPRSLKSAKTKTAVATAVGEVGEDGELLEGEEGELPEGEEGETPEGAEGEQATEDSSEA